MQTTHLHADVTVWGRMELCSPPDPGYVDADICAIWKVYESETSVRSIPLRLVALTAPGRGTSGARRNRSGRLSEACDGFVSIFRSVGS